MLELGRNSPEENLRVPKRAITIVLDNIRSGNNVGSILRTADAFGVQHVHLCGISAQPPNRQVIKSSLGAEDSVNWTYWEDTSEAILALKKDHVIWIVEQTLRSEKLGSILEEDEQSAVALVFGNEVNGVQESLLSYAHKCVEIPQSGHKHSFNVAVCAGIVLWEMCRE